MPRGRSPPNSAPCGAGGVREGQTPPALQRVIPFLVIVYYNGHIASGVSTVCAESERPLARDAQVTEAGLTKSDGIATFLCDVWLNPFSFVTSSSGSVSVGGIWCLGKAGSTDQRVRASAQPIRRRL